MRISYSTVLRLGTTALAAAVCTSCGSGSHAYTLGVPPLPAATATPTPRPSVPAPSATSKATGTPGGSPTPSIAATATPLAAASPAPTPSPIPTPTGPATIAPATNLTQTFASGNVPAAQWKTGGYTCLSAGDATTPATSIPACPSQNDPNGAGYLRITSNVPSIEGFAVSQTPIILAAGYTGITVTFDYYSYGGNGADGLCVFLLNATQPIPTVPGATGGGLGYTGIAGAYVGLGLDSYGNFSGAIGGPGGPGFTHETIAIRGGTGASFGYIGGYRSMGVAASLPFNLDAPSVTRPTPLTVSVSFNSVAATATVRIDRHDGMGFITYISNANLSVAGEPAFPSRIYLGFSASNGGLYDYHEVGNVTITPS